MNLKVKTYLLFILFNHSYICIISTYKYTIRTEKKEIKAWILNKKLSLKKFMGFNKKNYKCRKEIRKK